MPSCAATRRASSTSAALQHPESLSPPHSLSVTPVTSWPSACSTAAATDESTPPLIITRTRLTLPPRLRRAAGGSATAFGHDRRARRRCRLGRSRVTEAEAHRRSRPLASSMPIARSTCDGIDRARAARRARRRVHAVLIERDEQRLRLDARERAVQDSLDAMQRVAVDDESGNRARQPGLEPVAQLGDSRALGGSLRVGRRAAPPRARRSPATFWVPARRAPSWPPPSTSGTSSTPSRTTSAPTPLGPPNLCPEIVTRSRPAPAIAQVEPGRRLHGVGVQHRAAAPVRARARRPRRAAGRCRSRC